METLNARMPNPAMVIPEAMKPIQALFGSISAGGVPQATLDQVHLRVSQACGAHPHDRHGQLIQPAQRQHQAASGNLGLSWGFLAARKDALRLSYGSGEGGRKS